MSYELKGTVKRVMETWKSETSDFTKREFVITAGDEYPNDVKFTAIKDKASQLEGLKEGDEVLVHFDIRGREYDERFYVDLNAWKIEKQKGAPAASKSNEQPIGEDDLPF